MTKTLLMINHKYNSGPHLDDTDIIEVEAYVVGGLDGVFAIYRLENNPSIYYFASGDDGNWWRISNGLHSDWLNGVYLALAECMLDRDKELI